VRVATDLERCLAAGGVAVFPSDTVYGLAADPLNRAAVERLYALKERPLSKPSAVMFFNTDAALNALPELGERTRKVMTRLLPGGVTLLLANPDRRFPLACGQDPESLGLRVPVVEGLAAVTVPVLQSSANLAGGADPRRLEDVPDAIRSAVDLVIDGGELPGTSSTVADLRSFEEDSSWSVIRHGAVAEEELREVLGAQFHFRPGTYLSMMRSEVPDYDLIQDQLAAASGNSARRILELGIGTGETAVRLLDRHPEATLVGIDDSPVMLEAARRALSPDRAELRVGRLEDPLPEGPFDLVASALCVHHLDGPGKADLFHRVGAVLSPGGRFVIADVVVPADPSETSTPLTPGFDRPSSVVEQLEWLAGAGFTASATWQSGDLAVIVAEPDPAS
jgi:tRNA threonylcarbamoyl adenosine modification protein (Sua5/YciO/YrdC/YwlC family)